MSRKEFGKRNNGGKPRDWRAGMRRVFPADLKIALVNRADSGPIGEAGLICAEYGISRSRLADWRHQISRGELLESASPKRGRKPGGGC